MTSTTNQGNAQRAIGDFAPKLAQLTDEVLFADVWERPALSMRDRSFATCAALIALGKTEQMSFHVPYAIRNGVTKEELVELTTHLAFYVGPRIATGSFGSSSTARSSDLTGGSA
jgi:4-carboxymuconolactone decarboxylase